ncbi:hypothetical protein GGX14DRAFT_570656 [Mycena pura]|uniref:Uncharacterized protein n=1 Tax=Mycena pura TaxID=153505 RepID=A0AAD6Y5I4_9AGAR|nr:hypothetical protein GGX14DRAFT_570656 [Mycena pura]
MLENIPVSRVHVDLSHTVYTLVFSLHLPSPLLAAACFPRPPPVSATRHPHLTTAACLCTPRVQPVHNATHRPPHAHAAAACWLQAARRSPPAACRLVPLHTTRRTRWQHDPQRAARSRLLLVACRSLLAACRLPLAARRSPLIAHRSSLAARRSSLAARRSSLVAASRSLPAALAHVALAHVALPAARARIVIVPLPRPPPSNLHVPPPAASRCSHVRHRCRPPTASCHPHQLPAIRARAVQDQPLVLLVIRRLLPAVPSPPHLCRRVHDNAPPTEGARSARKLHKNGRFHSGAQPLVSAAPKSVLTNAAMDDEP